MTTDDLERDLKTLAEPRPGDEHVRLAIRASLSDQLRGRPRFQRPSRLAFGFAALAAASAAAVIVALVGIGGSGGPTAANAAILAHVVRSMSPPAEMIVHVKEAGTNPDGTPVGVEWWQETNPPYAIRLIKRIGSSEHEGATSGTSCSLYHERTNTIDRHTGCRPATLVDPVETARAGLISGTAQVAGKVTIGGRSLYEIELPDGVVGYFDQTDYRPVYIDNPQRDGSVVRTHVLAYEELPPTSENEQLVSLTAQHPDARVETSVAPRK